MTGLRADAVLFDKDGTLFDFNATWVAWVEGMLDRWSGGENELADRLAASIGFDRPARRFLTSSVVIAGTPNDVAEAVATALAVAPASLVSRLNTEATAAPTVEAVPLMPLLEGFAAAGLRLGVATNDAEAPARAHLAAAGVEAAFDFIAGSDSGHGGKPAPGMLLAFAEAVDIAPARVVMVGDSTHDLLAGRAAGMQTIGVLTGLADTDSLAPLADAVLPDIGHLSGWLSSG